MWSTLWLGWGLGMCPLKCFKFRPSEVASGVLCNSRRLVAEILLHVEINCLKCRGGWGYPPFSLLYKTLPVIKWYTSSKAFKVYNDKWHEKLMNINKPIPYYPIQVPFYTATYKAKDKVTVRVQGVYGSGLFKSIKCNGFIEIYLKNQIFFDRDRTFPIYSYFMLPM